ncbi:MAG TPA: alpha/beta hydrolase [Rhodobacterales bacterium]|nr:alpha/beta hydrolase [Rhodobacterales bacterium]
MPTRSGGKRKFILGGIAAMFVAAGGFALWTARGSTPAFTDPNGAPVPGAVAEERWIELGGVRQYVLLRGRDRTAPLLINVHGGPGMSERALYRYHNAMLEDHFVVIYWDQRGAGKSFDTSLDPTTLTIDRMSRDLSELVDVIRAEFGQDKVLLLAHSWGTVLALEHIARRPETVAGYIGIGQVTTQLESEIEGYNWLLGEAEARGEPTATEALRALGPPPWTADQMLEERDWLYKLNGFYAKPPAPINYIRQVLATPETAWTDIAPMFKAMPWSIQFLWDENQTYDAFARHPSLDAPIFLLLGRHDHAVSPGLAEAWLAQLDAPLKEAIWYETAGHMVPAEDPPAFNRDVLRIARQLGLIAN